MHYITPLNVANPLIGLCVNEQYSFYYLQLMEERREVLQTYINESLLVA